MPWREVEAQRAVIQWRAHGFCVAYVPPENFLGIMQIQSVLPVRTLDHSTKKWEMARKVRSAKLRSGGLLEVDLASGVEVESLLW